MKLNRVTKNIFWILICRIVQAICALIINALTARFFGPSKFGIISYAASLVAFVTPLMKLGISDIIVDEIIKKPDHEGEILGTAIVLTSGSSLLCIVGLLSFVSATNPEDTTTILTVFLYSLLLFAQSMEQIQYWFHAKYLSHIVSVTALSAYFVVSGYKIVLLIAQKNVYWFAASNAIDHLLISLVLLFIYRKKRGQPLRVSWNIAGALWNRGSPYILPELMGLVLQQSDRVMLQYANGNYEVGLYSAALSTASMASFIFSAIIMSYRPLVLENKLKSAAVYEKNMTKLHGIVMYLSILQCVVVLIFGQSIIDILYGANYLESVSMLKIVICYTFFSNIGAVRAVWILAESKQKYLWIISLLGMVLNVVLNAILIKLYDGEGAAVATLLTQVFTNIIMVAAIKPLRANIRYIWAGLNVKKWMELGS